MFSEFKNAVENNNLERVKYYLNKGVDPSDCNSYVIRIACDIGRLEIVKLLLMDYRVDPSVGNNYPIRSASESGYKEIAKLLLMDYRVDPSDIDNQAIRWASRNGHVEVVKLLFKDNRVRNSLRKEDITGLIEKEYKLNKLKKLRNEN